MAPHQVLPNVRFCGETIFAVTLKSPISQGIFLIHNIYPNFSISIENFIGNLRLRSKKSAIDIWAASTFRGAVPLTLQTQQCVPRGTGVHPARGDGRYS